MWLNDSVAVATFQSQEKSVKMVRHFTSNFVFSQVASRQMVIQFTIKTARLWFIVYANKL